MTLFQEMDFSVGYVCLLLNIGVYLYFVMSQEKGISVVYGLISVHENGTSDIA